MAEFPNKGWTNSSVNRLLLSHQLMQPALYRQPTNYRKNATVSVVANRVLIKEDNMNCHVKLNMDMFN